MKKVIIFFVLCCVLPMTAVSWNVLVYMDSSDELSDMAIKNITDMIRVPVEDSVTILAQLHSYSSAGLRYQITNNGLSFRDEVILTGNPKYDLIEAARWAFSDNNSDHTMLIMWNHGWGILDPEWNDDTQEWEVGADALSNSCSIKRRHEETHKGFMFSVEPRTYLNNQDMIDGLACIQNEVLDGKKIDILAFDTCMGGMLEVSYQVAPYAHYLVGNQTCSLLDGFDYTSLVKILNQQLTPRDLAANMVRIFDEYYKKHDDSAIYVHTAMDNTYVFSMVDALDEVIKLLLTREGCTSLLLNAHRESPRFCLFPMYTDLVSFIKQVEEQLSNDIADDLLKQKMHHFYNTVRQFVVANCAGYQNEGRVYGCSIYSPASEIHESYRRTLFGKQSQWVSLLEKYITTGE